MQKERDIVRIVSIIVLIVVFCFVRTPQGILGNQFIHANIFHLACNCIALWAVLGRGIATDIVTLMLAWCLGFIGFCLSPAPVVGVSGIVFASIGLQAERFLKSMRNVATIAICLLMGLIVPDISVVAHLVPFVLGIAFWLFGKISDDYGEVR